MSRRGAAGQLGDWGLCLSRALYRTYREHLSSGIGGVRHEFRGARRPGAGRRRNGPPTGRRMMSDGAGSPRTAEQTAAKVPNAPCVGGLHPPYEIAGSGLRLLLGWE